MEQSTGTGPDPRWRWMKELAWRAALGAAYAAGCLAMTEVGSVLIIP